LLQHSTFYNSSHINAPNAKKQNFGDKHI
jgi:hypothetical protein